jgi:hypothetical protein
MVSPQESSTNVHGLQQVNKMLHHAFIQGG